MSLEKMKTCYHCKIEYVEDISSADDKETFCSQSCELENLN